MLRRTRWFRRSMRRGHNRQGCEEKVIEQHRSSIVTAAHAAAKPASSAARRSSSQQAYYTASWAVEITAGGTKMADLIAERNGFTNLGEV